MGAIWKTPFTVMAGFVQDLEIRYPHISVNVTEFRCAVTQSKPGVATNTASRRSPPHHYPTLLLSTNGYRPAAPRTLVPDTTAATPTRGRMTTLLSALYNVMFSMF